MWASQAAVPKMTVFYGHRLLEATGCSLYCCCCCCFMLPQLVFTEVALGAVVLTVNVILLGGNIVFFQSLCLIGYCLFPIVIAGIVCTFVKLSVGGRSGSDAS
jgi:hypothetical protein